MQRTVLGFSLRNTEDGSASVLVERVGHALGISLTSGEYQQLPAWVATAFGMSIALFRWGGPDDTMLSVLEGEVTDPAFVVFPGKVIHPAERLDISDAVADVLEVRGAGSWHRPTPKELAAHTRYSRAHED
jgi:hypothetical protein